MPFVIKKRRMASSDLEGKHFMMEKDALAAELEVMRAERRAFEAEKERIRAEKEALQIEKAQIEAEKEAMKAEMEALRVAREAMNSKKKSIEYKVSNKEEVTVKKIKLQRQKSSSIQAKRIPKPRAVKKVRVIDTLGIDSKQVSSLANSDDLTALSKLHKGKKTKMKVMLKTARSSLKRKKPDDGGSHTKTAPFNDDDLENLHVRFEDHSPNQTNAIESSSLISAPDANIKIEDESEMTETESSETGKSQHICNLCGKDFPWLSHYQIHMRMHTGEKPYSCNECRASFTRANNLTVHLCKHVDINKLKTCKDCGLLFPSAGNLHKHIQRSHSGKIKLFHCSECKEAFPKASSLAIHMAVHSGGKPFKCQDCKASFTSQGNLTVHRRKHSGLKPFKCQDCDATFPRSADLRSHVRKHSTVRPYKCLICGASFCRSGDLKPHMRIHTGERPFQCEVCGAAFSTSSNLSVHRRTHTGERPFQCEKCGAAFSQLGHLTRHKQQHMFEQNFKCSMCGAAFGNAYHLKVHMQRHNTENTFRCKCGAAFSRASILTEHMRIHTGEKPYKCSECPAAFARSANLAAHKRKHTGERPYKCNHCGAAFTQSTSLNRHLQSKHSCPQLNEDDKVAQEESSLLVSDSDVGDTLKFTSENNGRKLSSVGETRSDNCINLSRGNEEVRTDNMKRVRDLEGHNLIDATGFQNSAGVSKKTENLIRQELSINIGLRSTSGSQHGVADGCVSTSEVNSLFHTAIPTTGDVGLLVPHDSQGYILGERVTSPIVDALTAVRSLESLGSYYNPRLSSCHLQTSQLDGL